MTNQRYLLLVTGFVLSVLIPAGVSAQGNRDDAPHVVLNFKDVPLDVALADLAESIKKTFVFDERLTGKLTLVSGRAVSGGETISLVRSRLQAQGFEVGQGPLGSFVIHPIGLRIDTRSPNNWICDRVDVKNGFISLDLRYVDISSVVEVMKDLTPRDITYTEGELPAGFLTIVSGEKFDLREGCLVLEAALSLKELVLVEEAESLRVISRLLTK